MLAGLACGVLAFASVASCRSSAPTEPVVPPGFEFLYGTWDWRYACCDIGGRSSTPESTGRTHAYRFERNGRLEIFLDDTLWVRTNYRVDTEESATGKRTLLRHGDDFAKEEELFRISADSIRLVIRCYDCYGTRLYTRRRS